MNSGILLCDAAILLRSQLNLFYAVHMSQVFAQVDVVNHLQLVFHLPRQRCTSKHLHRGTYSLVIVDE